MKKSINYILFVFTTIFFISGCATTNVTYNKLNNTLTITNEGEDLKIGNMNLVTKHDKNYVVKNQGNTEYRLYISKDNPTCTFINIFKLLPLDMDAYYQTSVYEDLQGKFTENQIKKVGEVYIGQDREKATLAFDVDGMHGVSSKTYISTSAQCLDTLIGNIDKNSIWSKTSK